MTPHDKSLTDEKPSLVRKTEKKKKKSTPSLPGLKTRIDWEDKKKRDQYGR